MKNLKIQLLHNNSWHDIDIENLRKGNIFRVFDEEGRLIPDNYGNTNQQCICDAYFEDDAWNVQSKGIELNTEMENINE